MIEGFINITDDGQIENLKGFLKKAATLKPGRHYFKIEPKNKRTLPQNAWLHAILPEIAKRLYDLGWYDIKTPNDAKKFIKALFFRKVITNGKISQEIVEDTSDTSKEDFTERAEEIIAWCWEYLNLNVAPPGKQVKMYQHE